MNRNSKAIWITVGILFVIWLLLQPPSNAGYGYHGHGGYHSHSGGGWFYYGNSTVYSDTPSNRKGSPGGPGNQGRGLHGGK